MGVEQEVHFVKVTGGRLLQGPVMVRSCLWDGEIEIATIPDYCAYLRVMSWMDIFGVEDTAAVRARYEEERARGGYEIPDRRGLSKTKGQGSDKPVRLATPHRTKPATTWKQLSLFDLFV